VGFDDVQQLRRFVVSPEFLQFFDHYDLKWSAALRVKGAMAFIRDEFLDGDAPEKHSLSIDDIGLHAAKDKRKYTNKEQPQRDRRMVHLLILMVKTFGSGGEPVSDIDGEKDFSASLMGRPKRNHGESVPTVPAGIEVLRPTLMPFGLEETETDLERYDRAYTLLKYFGYSISSKAHWPKRFGKTGWDASVQVNKHYIPSWMKETPPTTVV
jgi:hypothetical protein